MRLSRKIFMGVAVVGLTVGLVTAGPLLKVLFHDEVVPAVVVPAPPNMTWRDGVYIGQAVNQRGETNRVEVMVVNGKFHHIRALDSEDTSIVFTKVFSQVSKQILMKNSTEVDGVSGATVSSQGIVDAVNNALEQAKK